MGESKNHPVHVHYGEDAAGALHPIRTDVTGRPISGEDDSTAVTVEEHTLEVLESLLLESKRTNELLELILEKL